MARREGGPLLRTLNTHSQDMNTHPPMCCACGRALWTTVVVLVFLGMCVSPASVGASVAGHTTDFQAITQRLFASTLAWNQSTVHLQRRIGWQASLASEESEAHFARLCQESDHSTDPGSFQRPSLSWMEVGTNAPAPSHVVPQSTLRRTLCAPFNISTPRE